MGYYANDFSITVAEDLAKLADTYWDGEPIENIISLTDTAVEDGITWADYYNYLVNGNVDEIAPEAATAYREHPRNIILKELQELLTMFAEDADDAARFMTGPKSAVFEIVRLMIKIGWLNEGDRTSNGDLYYYRLVNNVAAAANAA